jgi:hypothetical protein
MTISSVKTGAIGDSLLAGNAAFIPNDYESIATVTVGSGGASTISFTSIPSTYQHLQIRGIARTTASQDRESLKLTFNSDTGSNYARHSLWGSGSAASAFGEASTAFILLTDFAAATATASIFGSAVTDVLDYKNTNKYTTVRSLGGVDLNAAVTVFDGLNSGLWMNTAAVSSITLTPFSGSNFVQYSSFALYGIKG